jgi:hypothetical protein
MLQHFPSKNNASGEQGKVEEFLLLKLIEKICFMDVINT